MDRAQAEARVGELGPEFRILNCKKTAEILGVTPQVIYKLVRRKRLSPLAGFGKLRFSAQELSRFISETR